MNTKVLDKTFEKNGYTATAVERSYGIVIRITKPTDHRYRPDIHVDDPCDTKDGEPRFGLSTVTYGAVYGTDLDLYIKGIKEASEALRYFEKIFK